MDIRVENFLQKLSDLFLHLCDFYRHTLCYKHSNTYLLDLGKKKNRIAIVAMIVNNFVDSDVSLFSKISLF